MAFSEYANFNYFLLGIIYQAQDLHLSLVYDKISLKIFCKDLRIKIQTPKVIFVSLHYTQSAWRKRQTDAIKNHFVWSISYA